MRSRVLWRRSAAAIGIYGSTLLGFVATIVAARELSKDDLARFALVLGTTMLLQLFVDLTIDEVVVVYGNRYAVQGDWGRFQRLFRVGLLVKLLGGALGSIAVVVAAVLSPWLWQTGGVAGAMLIVSLIPLIQQPEGMAGAVLLVRNRYDIRGAFLLWAMALRLVAIAMAAPHGLLPLCAAIVVAQAVSTVSVCAVGLAAFRRYPSPAPEPLDSDRRPIRAFAIQSTIASGLTSLRTSLPTLLVGVVAKGSQVADFRVAQAPQTAYQSLSAPARLVLLAEQTRDVAHGRVDRAFALLRQYIAGTAAIALVATPLLWIFMPTLVRVLYGDKYLPATSAFRVMLLVASIQLVLGWSKSFPVSIGRPGMRTASQLLEIVVLVPAVLALASLYGATGAACGVLAGSVALAVFWAGGLVWLRGRPVPGHVHEAAA